MGDRYKGKFSPSNATFATQNNIKLIVLGTKINIKKVTKKIYTNLI